MPVTHSLVLERIQFLLSMEQQAMEEVPEAPTQSAPNAKKAGTREGDKVPIKGEKHKGSTKGTPK